MVPGVHDRSDTQAYMDIVALARDITFLHSPGAFFHHGSLRYAYTLRWTIERKTNDITWL
jgi:hypothetical protein